jgi:hypothetical protein
MPITFAADFDYSTLRHVSVRSRKNREVELPPMPTAEEIEKWKNRELRFGTMNMGWVPNYEDGVDARRDAEKKRRDEAARKRLERKPVTFLEEFSALKVRSDRPVTSDQRIVAEVVKTDPQILKWSHTISTLPASEVIGIARRCSEAVDPTFSWNLNVRLLEPRYPAAMLHGRPSTYLDPTRASAHTISSLGFQPKRSNNAMISEWMRAAEEDRLEGRSTKCALTGRSLVIRTNYFGRRSWKLAPAFHGMSVEAAQQVASAAAIQVGLVRGVVRGTPPPMVEQLRKNAQDWLSLVIATGHPIFYTVAMHLIRSGAERLTFSDNPEQNRNEWERFSSMARSNEPSVLDPRQ